jgi:hypothetical protein
VSKIYSRIQNNILVEFVEIDVIILFDVVNIRINLVLQQQYDK